MSRWPIYYCKIDQNKLFSKSLQHFPFIRLFRSSLYAMIQIYKRTNLNILSNSECTCKVVASLFFLLVNFLQYLDIHVMCYKLASAWDFGTYRVVEQRWLLWPVHMRRLVRFFAAYIKYGCRWRLRPTFIPVTHYLPLSDLSTVGTCDMLSYQMRH